ncbi:MAG: radical SAM protein [Candidatus Pacebacteria bacterium]|nr:radical SAM protein [Candidatus Paceibacterota bacterium]
MNKNKKYVWSNFCVKVPTYSSATIYKSTLTGAVVRISKEGENNINSWLERRNDVMPSDIQSLVDPNVGLLIQEGYNEYSSWRNRFIDKRNDGAHIFILHFLPTIQCQFRCNYCFENGGNRGMGMKAEIIQKSRKWLYEYLVSHPEINKLRFVLFGGEPLLRKDIVTQGLHAFHSLAKEKGVEFWCELVSNGELLNETTASILSKYEWRRVQITLDGPKDVHNNRRYGHNKRPTFAKIIRNVQMLLSTNYISKVDIRISFDFENADSIQRLIKYLAGFNKQYRINLSLGLITPTFQSQKKNENEHLLASKVIATWKVAQEYGFKIPDEFITGPWCIAIAKHSAILQPDGALQKCLCTAGRKEYNFATIAETPKMYLKDARFEHFRRTNQCIEEKCSFLPMCGGGCIHDAIVEHCGPDGFNKRFCQKTLLAEYNKGLLNLKYS